MKLFHIYIIFSLLIAMIVWWFSTDSIVANLYKTLHQSNIFMSNEIEKSINELEENVRWYPEYKPYEEECKRIDTLLQLNATENDTLFNFLSDLFSNERHLTNFSQNEKSLYVQNNILSTSWRLQKRYVLANHFKDKAKGIKLCCFCGPELIYINNKVVEPNQVNNLKFGVTTYEDHLQYVRFWINGKTALRKDNKAIVKQKATKSGWNDLNIKYQGEYKNEIFTDSLTYRYFVCE